MQGPEPADRPEAGRPVRTSGEPAAAAAGDGNVPARRSGEGPRALAGDDAENPRPIGGRAPENPRPIGEAEPPPAGGGDEPSPAGGGDEPSMPDYRGAPLDAERGPGLGCFWLQVVILTILLILTPITVVLAFPPWVSATLLILSLVVLLFVGQTTIFLLRLVAADRRSRRRPRSPSARKTVGMLEADEREERRGDDGA